METRSATHTFAGLTFKTSKRGLIRKPTVVKLLRSGKVHVVCTGRYTDDYAFDAAYNFCKGGLSPEAVLKLADDIERSPSGWWCSPNSNGKHIDLGCHSFLGYDIFDATQTVTAALEASAA